VVRPISAGDPPKEMLFPESEYVSYHSFSRLLNKEEEETFIYNLVEMVLSENMRFDAYRGSSC